MAWASAVNSTTLLFVATFVLIATGCFATWRVRRSASERIVSAPVRSPLQSASATRPPRTSTPSTATDLALRRQALQRSRASAMARPTRLEPPEPTSSDVLYIGSINLMPTPVPPTHTQAAGAKRPAIQARPTQEVAEDFMQWLRDGMTARTLQVNTPQSALHFTDAGMVLVYPAIFQAYANACATPARPQPELHRHTEQVQTVLQAVCTRGWHESGPFDSRLLHFELLQPRSEPAIVKGLVIQSPQRFIDPLPPSNPALSRLL